MKKGKKLSSCLITAADAGIPKYRKKKRLTVEKLPKTWWNEDCEITKQSRKKEKIFRNTPLLS